MMESSQALITALQKPEIYPHPVGPIELVETHISWVLLTGDRVYKIKKPVDFGFLDFTTLERRRHFCEEEVRLNRRLAPQLYLGVVAIGGTPDEPCFNEGVPFEYAVEMSQFDQSLLADRLLAAGELAEAELVEAAASIARFHASAARVDPETPFGTATIAHAPVRQNFEQIAAMIDDESDLGRLEQVRCWAEAQYAALADTMEQRRKEGHVRECHGDIHLGNMARLEGQLTLFDGIEFNDSFRWIDSCADIAFLIMDLHDRKRADLANCVLDRYLEESGDQAALALLRYYLSYRAMVRAKVACFRLGQPGLDDTAREQVIATFRSYLGLAERQAKPPRPWLAITHGLSASGKSHIAGELVRAAGAIRLRSDVERKRLFGLEADARTGSPLAGGLYSSDASARTYRRLEELAEQILLAGYPVVVDATFLHLAGRQQFRALAERLKVPFHLLAIDCSEELLRKRITSRRDDPSEATLAVLESQIASREPVSEAESGTIRIDGAAPDIDQLLATINPESRE